MERKRVLHDIIKSSNTLVTKHYIIGDGTELHELTKKKGMEGIVEKSLHSSYQLNTRSPELIKHKHFKFTQSVILGYKENPFTTIVGSTVRDKMIPVAQVEFGFKPEETGIL